MKKSFTLVLSLILILIMLAGCGTSTPKITPKETTPDDSIVSTVATETVTTETVDEIFEWEGTVIDDLTEKGMALDELIIPDAATAIGHNACSNAKMTKLTIGANVETIDDKAFFYCENIKEVIIPSSVKTIGYEAFSSCGSLEKITFSEGLEAIGERAFYGSFSSMKDVAPIVIIFPEGLKQLGPTPLQQVVQ